MSFLNPKPDNPVKKYFEWKSEKKAFQYYDKDKSENVLVDLPVKFIVLDEFATITGYNAKTEKAFFSNEVSKLDKEILNVRAFKTNFSIVGLYKDIKDKIAAENAKFAKSVYGILYTKDSYEIVNFKLSGSALGTWIEKKFNTDKYAVVVNKYEEDKNGAVTYYKPIFEIGTELKPELKEKLRPMAIELQSYLDSRKDTEASKEIAETQTDETHNQDVPFPDANIEDYIAPVDDDEMPF